MYLMHGDQVLKSYRIDLGFAPEGDKKFEGDGRTPEGEYIIDRRNPESRFYLSLGISYPSEEDIAEARALGRDPGGDIFIHGGPRSTPWSGSARRSRSIHERLVRDRPQCWLDFGPPVTSVHQILPFGS